MGGVGGEGVVGGVSEEKGVLNTHSTQSPSDDDHIKVTFTLASVMFV